VSPGHEQWVFADATRVAPNIVSDAYPRGGCKKRDARNGAKLFK
jgi:deoxyhypusine synthase